MEKIINIKNIIKSICVFIIFWGSSYIQLIPIYLLHINPKSNPQSIIIINFIMDILISIILYFIYKKDLKKEFKIFKDNFLKNIDIGSYLWIIGVFIMLISNVLIQVFFNADTANNEKLVRSMISILPVIMIINAGIIGPFNEEIVFRKAIKDAFNNKWLFIFFSFLLFGGGHIINSINSITDLLYIIPYGSLGIVFAIMYNKTDTVFTSMFFHMLHNTALSLLLLTTLI